MVVYQGVLQHPSLEAQVPNVLPHASLAPLLIVSGRQDSRETPGYCCPLPPGTGLSMMQVSTTNNAEKPVLGSKVESQQQSLPVM